jgi:hypothetical protein
MQKHFTFLITLFIGLNSIAQVNLDSLWNVWNDKSQSDTIRLNAIRTIAWDGYVDQFGGEKEKKFKAKAFRELLLSIQDKAMEEQKKSIDEAFETWKGDLEQIDDVCVIGIRV